MQRFLLFLFVLVSVAACKKPQDADPQPKSLADRFAGTYTLTSFRYLDTSDQSNYNFPELPLTKDGTTLSGTVTLVKKSDTRLDLKLLLKATGADDSESNIPNLEARQVGSEYGLFANDVRVADVEGSMIIFNFSQTDPQTQARLEMAFNARR